MMARTRKIQAMGWEAFQGRLFFRLFVCLIVFLPPLHWQEDARSLELTSLLQVGHSPRFFQLSLPMNLVGISEICVIDVEE